MISVVMATYNGEQYVQEQLISILNQTQKPDEIVINDDKSTDATVKIILDIQQRTEIPITLQVNEKRMGYAQNFRRAIRRAKGEIIFLSDQDDVWLKDKIAICMAVMDSRSEVLALSTGYYLSNDVLGERKASNYWESDRLVNVSWKSFIRHPKYPGMAMVFRKDIWRDVDEMEWKPNAAHDWMINQFAAAQGGLYRIGSRTVIYRQHGENTEGVIINRTPKDIKNSRLKLIDSLIDELQSIRTKEKEKRNFVEKALIFQKQRRMLLQSGKILRLLIYELNKSDCISMRSVLGDMFVSIKSRRGNYV